MTGKQRVREILESKKWYYHDPDELGEGAFKPLGDDEIGEALDSIGEVVKEVIGQENEHYKDMPVPDPDPFALPSDHQNQLRRYQLGRWEGNNGQ